MKASRASVAAAVAALVAAAAALTAPASARPASSSSDGYIVVLADSARAGVVADAHAQRFGADVGLVYRHALKGYSARMSETAAQRVAQAPNVLWVERDKPMEVAAQTMPTGIDRVDAELSPTALINGVDERVNVDVAVIDTGIDLDHPDLNVYRAGGKNCDNPLLPPDDDNGHGTHVAGTIGALDNGDGVVGVAPGARVWPIKVLGASGVGLTSSVICGIDYVTANAGPIEVANMSLGGGGSDDGNCGNSNNDAMHRAICRSVNGGGVTYAVAAGNSSADASTSTPAAYDEVITVSALADFNGKPGGGAASTCRSDVDDTFANFSNYGADVDIIAPGVCIRSTYMLGGYSTLSGTSMASPHVAGGAALYMSTPTTAAATPTQVKNHLQSTGTLDWNDVDDPDPTKERLLNVATY